MGIAATSHGDAIRCQGRGQIVSFWPPYGSEQSDHGDNEMRTADEFIGCSLVVTRMQREVIHLLEVLD